MNLPIKQSYRKHLEALEGQIHDCEHFRGWYNSETGSSVPTKKALPPWVYEMPHEEVMRPMNAAVVVLKDGRAFVGVAKCNYKDQYSRSRGHEIAVGRALQAASACLDPEVHWFKRVCQDCGWEMKLRKTTPIVYDSDSGMCLAGCGQRFCNVESLYYPRFILSTNPHLPEGVELRDYCREKLEEMKVLSCL